MRAGGSWPGLAGAWGGAGPCAVGGVERRGRDRKAAATTRGRRETSTRTLPKSINLPPALEPWPAPPVLRAPAGGEWRAEPGDGRGEGLRPGSPDHLAASIVAFRAPSR